MKVENYRQGKLAPDELLSVDDHLAVCRQCRQHLETALGHGAGEMALYAELSAETEGYPHLSFEQSAGYVEGLLVGDESQMVKDHLASCAECTIAMDELRALRNQIAPDLDREYRPRSPIGGAEMAVAAVDWRERIAARVSSIFFKPSLPCFGAALAALLLSVAALTVAWMAWRATQKRALQPPIATTSPTPASQGATSLSSPTPAPSMLAKLNDGGGVIMLDGQGRLSGVDNLPPAYQHLVKEALTAQRVEKSPLLVALSRPKGTLMGNDEEGNQFSVIEPVGTVVLTRRPRFRWSKLQGATGYVVEVYDAKFDPVANSGSLKQTIWTPGPLIRGQVYSWQVKAFKNGEEYT